MPFENLSRYFQSGISFIKQAIASGGNVLVHCYAGISRSASMVIAYLMQEMDMPNMFHTLSYVRSRRPIVFPNPGFQRQLMEFEKYCKSKLKHKGDKTVGSAPTVNTNNQQQNFTDQLNSIQQQNQKSPQKHKSIIDKVYASPVQKSLMHSKDMIEQKQYVSQSADKGGKAFQSRLQHAEAKTTKNNYNNNLEYIGKQNLMQSQSSKNPYPQDPRSQTSQVQNRAKIGNNYEAAIKQELKNRLNGQNNVQQYSPYSKQIRAKSSYGNKQQNNISTSHKQRNISEHTLPAFQNISDTIDPKQAYFQQSQSQFGASFQNATKQNSTIAQSMYNSISRQRQESTESLNDRNAKKEHQQAQDQNLQYFCDHCNIALFTTKDLIDHSSNINLTQRGQFKFNTSSNNNSNHQSKFSISGAGNQQQVFGKTFTDMNSHKCGSLFIKRKEWISEQDGNEGNILCPRKSCAVKIGSYCWQGTRCSTCGQFVSPAFQIFRNRVRYRIGEFALEQDNGKSSQKYDQLSRTPEQKRKNYPADNFQNSLNLSYTAESKQAKSKSRRQNSNVDDLTKLKLGYQGLVQSLTKAQVMQGQFNNGKNSKSSEKNKIQQQNRELLQSSYNQKQSQTLRKSNQSVNNGLMQSSQGQNLFKNNLNNVYNQLMLEQEKKVKQNSNYKQNNYQSPKRTNQQKQ